VEYLISEEKIAKIRTYRSQRVWDLMKEHDLDFLYLWDYGNTRYAFDIMPRFHPESDGALMGYLISKEGVVSVLLSDSFVEHHPYQPGGLYDPAKPGAVWTPDSVVRSSGSESYMRSVPTRWARLTAEAINANGPGAKRIGFDGILDLGAFQALQKLTPGVEYVGMGFDMAKTRMIKSAEELELMEASCEVHNRVLWKGMSEVEPGWVDFQLASRMAQLFALEPSVEQHCLNITYSYEPGGAMGMIWSPIGRVYKEGEVISSDCGIMTFGSATTDYGRTRILGETTTKIRDAYNWNILNCHELLTKIKPGMKISAMVEMFIDAHEKRGMPLVMLGHGLGTNMDEMPQMNPADKQEYDAVLEENMVLCIEPTCVVFDDTHGPQLLWFEDQWVVEKDGLRRMAPLSYFDIDDKDLATMK
jgi:Xaa-Pro aminopeptidase